jgi:hypothetical protein
MPRDGSGNYTQPFPPVVEGTTIESTVYNGYIADVSLDLNTARPIVAGGTGADNATDAMVNLKGEIAGQEVTNYDSTPIYPGSFFSGSTATAAPVAGNVFVGIAYGSPGAPNRQTLEARDTTTGIKYTRVFNGTTWSAWTQEAGSITDTDARYVNLTGDNMTGGLTTPSTRIGGAIHAWPFVVKAGPDINVGFTDAGGGIVQIGNLNDAGNAWQPIQMIARLKAVSGIEVTGNTLYVNGQEIVSSPANGYAFRIMSGLRSSIQYQDGNDFYFMLTNSGNPLGTFNSLRPFSINLATGNVTMAHAVTVWGNLAAANFTTNAIGCSSLLSTGGLTSNSGRIMSYLTGDAPSVAMWNTVRGARAMWVGDRFYFGECDASGSPGSSYFDMNTVGGVYRCHTSDAQKTGGGPWNSISDERIKTVTGDYTSGLDEILALQPVRYTFKGNDTDGPPSNSSVGATPDLKADARNVPSAPYPNSPHYTAATEGQEFIGLVAQQAEVSMPELVKQGEAYIDGAQVTDLRTLDTGPLIFALINAVKELKAEVDALKAQRR